MGKMAVLPNVTQRADASPIRTPTGSFAEMDNKIHMEMQEIPNSQNLKKKKKKEE